MQQPAVQDAEKAAQIDRAIEALQLARIRYELDRLARQPEPAQFCSVYEEELPPAFAINEDRAIACLAGAVVILLAIAYFLGLPA